MHKNIHCSYLQKAQAICNNKYLFIFYYNRLSYILIKNRFVKLTQLYLNIVIR